MGGITLSNSDRPALPREATSAGTQLQPLAGLGRRLQEHQDLTLTWSLRAGRRPTPPFMFL